MSRRRSSGHALAPQRLCTYVKEGHMAVLSQCEVDGRVELRIELGGSAHFTMSGTPDRLASQVEELRQRMAGSGWVQMD